MVGPTSPASPYTQHKNTYHLHTCLSLSDSFCPLQTRFIPQRPGCIRRGGRGGGSEGGGGGVWLEPPSSQGPPMPRRGQAENIEASILLAPKAPKQNVGCQSQTLEGEEGEGRGVQGGGGGPPPPVFGPSNTSLPSADLHTPAKTKRSTAGTTPCIQAEGRGGSGARPRGAWTGVPSVPCPAPLAPAPARPVRHEGGGHEGPEAATGDWKRSWGRNRAVEERLEGG